MFRGYTYFTDPQKRLTRLLYVSAYDPGAIYDMFRKSIEHSPTKERFLGTPELANLLYLPEVQLIAVFDCQGLMEQFETLKTVARGKAFFWTDDGDIGTAPQAVAVGDVVSFIPGIKIPMILRATQRNTYQVIGHAYVPCMMTGNMKDRDLLKVDEDKNLCDIFLV